MAIRKTDMPSSRVRQSTSTTRSSSMKLSNMLRRGSANAVGEVKGETENRRTSIPEAPRRSSLSTLPMRLRRRKTQPATEPAEQDTEIAAELGRMFFSLPCEILIQVIEHLDLQDIYHLRLASRSFYDILNYNSFAVTRQILPQQLASVTSFYIQTHLYPPDAHAQNLHHLFRTRRLQHIVDRQIHNLLAFVQMKIYMTRTATRVLSVSENRQRLSHALQRPAWFLNHFLEKYRDIITRQHPSSHIDADADVSSNTSQTTNCASCLAATRAVVSAYPEPDIIPTYHFYQLTLEHLQLATRAPAAPVSFFGSSARADRRAQTRQRAHAENIAIFLILGGVPEVRRVAMMQGTYESRTGAMMEFVDAVRQGGEATAAVGGSVIGADCPPKRSSVTSEMNSADETRQVRCDGGREDKEEDPTASPVSTPVSEAKLLADSLSWLPDVTFFHHIWRDRVQKCVAAAQEDVSEPYLWLQTVMSGSGLDFTEPRSQIPSLPLGPPPM